MSGNDPSANDAGLDGAEPVLLTAGQVAAMIQVSRRTLWRMLSANRLPAPIRIGGVVRWRIGEINRWIAQGCPESRESANCSAGQ